MEILDTHNDRMVDEKNVSSRQTGIKWGLYSGLASVLVGLIFNLSGLSKSGSTAGGLIVGLISLVTMVMFCRYAIIFHRDEELGGFITLGRCITICLWMGLIAGLMSSVFNFFYLKFIDPTAMEVAMERMREQQSANGASEAQIEAAESMAKNFQNPAITFCFALFGALFTYLITGLIAGLIMKKDRPFV
jgi:hypothetical protein